MSTDMDKCSKKLLDQDTTSGLPSAQDGSPRKPVCHEIGGSRISWLFNGRSSGSNQGFEVGEVPSIHTYCGTPI